MIFGKGIEIFNVDWENGMSSIRWFHKNQEFSGLTPNSILKTLLSRSALKSKTVNYDPVPVMFIFIIIQKLSSHSFFSLFEKGISKNDKK